MANLTIESARTILQRTARNARDTSIYSYFDLDTALLNIFGRFCRNTRAVRATTSLAITAASASLPTLPTGFTPEQTEKAWIKANPSTDGKTWPILLRNYENIQKAWDCGGGSYQARPNVFAFTDDSTGYVWPTPDADYTLYLRWWNLFGQWTAGTRGAYSSALAYELGEVVGSSGTLYRCIQRSTNKAPASNAAYWQSLGTGTTEDPTTTTINVVTDWARQIIIDGCAADLMRPLVENQEIVNVKWQNYLAYEASMIGFGGTGEHTTSGSSEWSSNDVGYAPTLPGDPWPGVL